MTPTYTGITPAQPPRPSPLYLLAEVPRAAWGVVSLPLSTRTLMAAPRGDGRPVMVLPGLFNEDRSNWIMRRYLRALGYRTYPWTLGRNLGVRAIGSDGARLLARLEAVHAEVAAPITLVGISLGGIMSRFLAHRRPDLVRQVITVSAPFAGHPRSTNVWRAFELLTGERVDSESVQAMAAECAQPLPVPSVAIWSASDGLVGGEICRDSEGRNATNVEVSSGHLFVQLRPQVLRAIADRIAAAP